MIKKVNSVEDAIKHNYNSWNSFCDAKKENIERGIREV